MKLVLPKTIHAVQEKLHAVNRAVRLAATVDKIASAILALANQTLDKSAAVALNCTRLAT